MKIVEPYAKMMPVLPRNFAVAEPGETEHVEAIENLDFCLDDGIALLRKIEWCARISHRSEEAQTYTSWRRIIQAVVLDHGDWSVVEHASVSVDMLVDRGITHELVRHRLFSFTQESTRFCNYGKKNGEITVIQPECEPQPRWYESVKTAETTYLELLSKKVSPQIARSVLPNSLASRIVVTGNLRNWRHFFIMRCTAESHPQMRQVTIPLLSEFKSKIPLLFDDIEPMAKQSEAMKRAR